MKSPKFVSYSFLIVGMFVLVILGPTNAEHPLDLISGYGTIEHGKLILANSLRFCKEKQFTYSEDPRFQKYKDYLRCVNYFDFLDPEKLKDCSISIGIDHINVSAHSRKEHTDDKAIHLMICSEFYLVKDAEQAKKIIDLIYSYNSKKEFDCFVSCDNCDGDDDFGLPD